MNTLKMEDLVEKVDSTSETTEQIAETNTESVATETIEQDPLKIELERVQKGSKYSEEERAEFTFKKQAQRLKDLGKDPASILGIERDEYNDDEENEDDKPVTLGMLKKLQKETATKTAFQEADEIQNETERELVKFHLQNTIKSTGNPNEDIKLARALVNAVKNTQVIEEINRKPVAKSFSNSSGVDAKQVHDVVYTKDELDLMRQPFNLTPAQILEARAGKKFDFKNARG